MIKELHQDRWIELACYLCGDKAVIAYYRWEDCFVGTRRLQLHIRDDHGVELALDQVVNLCTSQTWSPAF